MNTRKFTYKEMQEHLPDYVFNRINDEDRLIFENTILDFPDLQQEVKDVSTFFSNINSINFEKSISERTRNLSVKIHQRKIKQKTNFFSYKNTSKILVPSLGLLIIAFLIITDYNPFINNSKSKKINHISANNTKNLKSDEYLILNSSFASLVLDKNINDYKFIELSDELNNNTNSDFISSDQASIEEIITDYITDDYFTTFFKKNFLDDLSIIYFNQDDFDLLDEDEFQELIKEIENEDFAS